MMKQILLITDGCSNVGMDPAAAAAHAAVEGIVVNVIGIVDHGEVGARGMREIEGIAAAGRGMSRIVPTSMLSRTMQMMTRQTVAHTVKQAVESELRQIVGERTSIGDLPPAQRAEVVRVIDRWSESADLRVALLVDTSASMRPKLPAVQDAIRDLLLSLRSREGKSEISVFHFPGGRDGSEAVLDAAWTSDLEKVSRLFYKLDMKGATPTGPALMTVVRYYVSGTLDDAARMEDRERSQPSAPDRVGARADAAAQPEREGLWDGYVV
jgi:hypothetical protein